MTRELEPLQAPHPAQTRPAATPDLLITPYTNRWNRALKLGGHPD
jgi:hypothetical protein